MKPTFVMTVALVLAAPSSVAQDRSLADPRRFLIAADTCTVLGSAASAAKSTTFDGEKIVFECVFSGRKVICSDIAKKVPSTTLESVHEDRGSMIFSDRKNILMIDRMKGTFLWAQTEVQVGQLAILQKQCVGSAVKPGGTPP